MRGSFTRGLMVLATTGLLATACASTKEQAGKGDFREGMGPGGMATVRAPGVDVVYFDYDRADLRSDAQSTLKKNAGVIGDNKWKQVILEGHCDERGSEEYNLALGERRANAVKRYLTTLGVDQKRLMTVSYGESRPAVPGHDEEAWKFNRRVEFALPAN